MSGWREGKREETDQREGRNRVVRRRAGYDMAGAREREERELVEEDDERRERE